MNPLVLSYESELDLRTSTDDLTEYYDWPRLIDYQLATGEITVEQAQECICEVWCGDSGGIEDELLTLMACVGFFTDDAAAWEALPDVLTLYRVGDRDGPSWSLDPDLAYNLPAEQERQRKEIAKDDPRIRAHITRRAEDEVVLDLSNAN